MSANNLVTTSQCAPKPIYNDKTKHISALPPLKGRPWWVKLIVWIVALCGAAAILLVGIATLAVWILTPPRLTPLVEQTASSYLNADVHAKRVELTYWSTWPRLSLKVDSLTIVSKSLHGITAAERSRLPENADTLLTMEHFEGGIHMLNLLKINSRFMMCSSSGQTSISWLLILLASTTT